MPQLDTDLTTYSSWAAAKAVQLAGPSNPIQKPFPVLDCLAGLSFFFTVELSSFFSREGAVDIAKAFAGG